MGKMLATVVKELTPPLLYRGLRSLARRLSPARSAPKAAPPSGEEKPAEWYDAVYAQSDKYARHYSESSYYFMWTVIVDRLLRQGIGSIVDLGCGPGQFAALLRDKGIRRYCGIDLSTKCVELARHQCPDFEFLAANVLQEPVLEQRDYECLIALEFLEHVTDDLAVLQRLKPGVRFFGTVPSFPSASHVRHFTSADEVHARYANLFDGFQVDVLLKNPKGARFFLMEGRKTG